MEMEGRKWEDMSTDCLANIFGRLYIESLLLHIPAVCKSWYRALQNPLCWQKLDFHALGSGSKQSELIETVGNHSQRCAILHVLFDFCDTVDLIYLSEACPALKTLELHSYFDNFYFDDSDDFDDFVPSFKGKWKNLEFISIGDTGRDCIVQLIELVCIHSTKFTGLCIGSGNIFGHTASTIVSRLPKLKYLTINHATLEKKNLLLILQGCRELVHLDVRNCIGFDEDDEEILKLSSVIKSFQCDGSKAQDPIDFQAQDSGGDYYDYDDFDLEWPYDNCEGIEWD